MTTVPQEAPAAASEEAVSEALLQLSRLLEADGAAVRLVGLDEPRPRVTVAVDLDGVDCEECVLPPDQLRSVIEAGINKRAGGDFEVVVLDPRAPASTARPATVEVLDPRGGAQIDQGGGGPDAGTISGKRVGFRIDVLWPAWDLVVDEWSAALRHAGAAETPTWRRMQGLTGDEGRAKQAEYLEFLGSLDAAIVGLGNCGGCTAYTLEDSLSALEAGLPTLAVATAHFESLARSLASHRGRPNLRLLILPYPFHTLPEADVRAAARALVPDMFKALGVTV